MNIGGEELNAGVAAFALIGICISLFFEFINGFHDTANAVATVIWNFGTWYFGIPCSSSHSLIGSILGVSLAYTVFRSKQGEGIHWDQAGQVLMSLMVSPIVGFAAAALILFAIRQFIKTPDEIDDGKPPGNGNIDPPNTNSVGE
jgi:phosphate/sulfate permease